ncbi:hypothetical protein LCGC14_1779360 [marine sediment metagenome]|uniref:Uncharacterized protein n=1 Tax=marine sediment metagenome TaxID=412755 RepID=A0A0F9JVJ2_9ZZZZ
MVSIMDRMVRDLSSHTNLGTNNKLIPALYGYTHSVITNLYRLVYANPIPNLRIDY